MRSALGAVTFFNTVALARQAVRSLILVVEGEDDHFMLKNHVNPADVLLIAGVGGKPTVLEAAARAQRSGMRGIRFVVDVDYDKFTSPTMSYPANVLASKHHDGVMDVLLGAPHLIRRVVESHARTEVRRGAAIDPTDIHDQALALAAAVAPLRIANERHGYGISLATFPFGNVPLSSPTSDDLADAVFKRAQGRVTKKALSAQITAEKAHLGSDPALLAGDHDFFRALARALQARGVSARAEDLWASVLAGVLCAHLAATDWYRALVEWGDAHSRTTFGCPHAA